MSGEDPTTQRLDTETPLPELVHAVVTGARHLRVGAPCQDAVRGGRRVDAVVVAIADGHGTASHGDVGAQAAVEVAVERLLEFDGALGPTREDLRAVHAFAEHPLRVQLVRAWVERIRAHAGSAEGDALDLAPYGTTLLFALATADYLLVGQLGDGDVLVVDAGGGVRRPIPQDPRLFAEETTSLCLDGAWAQLCVVTSPPPIAAGLVLLSTDGYSKSYATDADFDRIGPDYLDLFRGAGALEVERVLPDFLRRVSDGGSGDDIAAAFMYWRGRGETEAGTNEPAPAEGGATCDDS